MKEYEFKKSDLPNLKKQPKGQKKKRRLKKWVWVFILIISLGVFGYSGFKICLWHWENEKLDTQIEEIRNIVKIDEVVEENEDLAPEIVNPPVDDDKPNDYWAYTKLPLINVDFAELKKKNSDTVAYLKVNGTNINYPVVQTNDNDYYISHSFDKKVNSAGWVFMETQPAQ